MGVGEFCNRDVIVTTPETDIREAARLMRQYHVGTLIVVERRAGVGNVPVGVVTDRDLVVEVLAEDVDPGAVTVRDVMSGGIETLHEAQGLWDALERLRAKGLRRLPVVDDAGALIGLLTLDDLIELLGEGLTDLAGAVKAELRRERRQRP